MLFISNLINKHIYIMLNLMLFELSIIGEMTQLNWSLNFVEERKLIILLFIILSLIIISIRKHIENNSKLIDELKSIIIFQNIEIIKIKEMNSEIELVNERSFENIDTQILNNEDYYNFQLKRIEFKINENQLITDETIDSFTEKINENNSVINSVIERLNNFELNSLNNNIIIGISYRDTCGMDYNNMQNSFYNHKPLYVNMLSDNIELSDLYYTQYSNNYYQLYITELFKLNNLKKINLIYSYPNHHMFICEGGDIMVGIILKCDYLSEQTYNILEKEQFEPYKPKHYMDIKYFEFQGTKCGLIYTTIECIAKVLKLKVFNNGNNCTELVYEKVDKYLKHKFKFLELFFKEMGYISS